MKIVDLLGMQIGRLKVVEKTTERRHGQIVWKCKCECGRISFVVGRSLTNGDTRSCGCLKREMNSKNKIIHGHTKNGKVSTEYRAYIGMKNRCYDKKAISYKHYGGAGIKVCSRWLESFSNFIEDMGEKPKGKYSIDRIDRMGDYEPSNCRWATDIQQANNKRNNVLIAFNGVSKTMPEWARSVNMNFGTFRRRLQMGWSMKKALYHPIRKRK